MNKGLSIISGILCAVSLVSCSVRTHRVIADHGRSGEAVLIKLEGPVLCQVGNQWYMKGNKTSIVRRNRDCLMLTKPSPDQQHPERYYLTDTDESDFEPVYAPIPEDMARNIQEGSFTHTDAISFINSKWIDKLPDGESVEVATSTRTPDYFRNMSSHRLIQTNEKSYLIANLGEMTADFSSLYMYPLAGLSALLIDMPGTLLLGPGYDEED